jgi:predicted kinase
MGSNGSTAAKSDGWRFWMDQGGTFTDGLGLSPADADDGAQEVFLVASRKLSVIAPGAEKRFLFATALRVASTRRRGLRRRREEPRSWLGEEELEPEPEHSEPGPERLAELGVPVVIDAGFWRREDRLKVRARLEQKGVRTYLHYFDVPEDELWQRLERRNRDLPKGTFEITREMFELFLGWFEPPGPDEEYRRAEA